MQQAELADLRAGRLELGAQGAGLVCLGEMRKMLAEHLALTQAEQTDQGTVHLQDQALAVDQQPVEGGISKRA